MKTYLIAYLIVAFLTATWMSSMEDTWVSPQHRMPYIACSAIGLAWPVFLPITMLALTTKTNRWVIEY